MRNIDSDLNVLEKKEGKLIILFLLEIRGHKIKEVVNDELCTSVNSHTLSIVEGNQCILS
jgi:hypothetical protein